MHSPRSLAWFVRMRLRRRLFAWFSATILATAVTVLAIGSLLPQPGRGGRFAVLAGALAVVWAASGLVARRLSRPLDELADVVRRLGNGDLSARASLGCRAHDEFGVISRAVNDMAARLEVQVNEQRELLATVSHELRTPLARQRVLLELIRGSPTPERLDGLERELEELDALVGGLLAQSRAELGLLKPVENSARELAARALERAGVGAAALSVTGGGAETLALDGNLLLRALGNLLENARTHGGGADHLVVTLELGSVRFEVLDRGPGVPAGVEPFGKFRRGGGGHEDGLGLGLSLVQSAARAHGGSAWIRPRDGGGTVAGLEIPRSR